MAVAVAVPLSLKILAAIHVAPGAMPIDVPPASPPTMTPIVAVPWPLRSVGVVGCWPYGSNQEFEPPRQRAAEVRVADVDAGVEAGDDDALAGVPEGPQGRGVDEPRRSARRVGGPARRRGGVAGVGARGVGVGRRRRGHDAGSRPA